jgi:hypothetical protein
MYTQYPTSLISSIHDCLKLYGRTHVLTTQLDTFANKPRTERTEQGILDYLVAYERTRSQPGLVVLEATSRSEHYAAKASVLVIANTNILKQVFVLFRDSKLSED